MIEYLRSCSVANKILFLLLVLVLYNSILVGTSYYTMAFCVMAMILIPVRKYIDRQAGWLIAFSGLYSLMHILLGISSRHIPLYLMAPLLFYCYGNFMVDCLQSRRAIIEFVAIVVFFFSVVTYYTCIIDIGEVGLINPLRIMGRSGVEDSSMAATLYGLNVSLGLACLFGFLSIDKTERTVIHYFLVLSFALSLLTTIHLVNRTGIVLAAISLIVFLMYSNKGSKSTWIIILLAIGILFYLSTKSGFREIFDAYTSRKDVEGHGFSDAGSRTEKWLDALSRLFSYPFGWYQDIEYTYTHNLWLDVARLTGIAPFIAIIGATIVSVKDTLRLYRIKGDYFALVLTSILVVFYLESFVEPVMEGFDLYFYLMCMFIGLKRRYIKNTTSSLVYKTE